MGILSGLFSRSASSGSVRRGIRSPWAPDSALQQIVWTDILEAPDGAPVTRAEAMTVPSVVKARVILSGMLAGAPLVELDERGPVSDPSPWLQRTDGTISPFHRMAWTVDDVLFSGWSLWATERSSRPARGEPVNAVDHPIQDAIRVDRGAWTFNEDGQVELDGQLVDAADAILLPGLLEGLLEYASRTIRAARHLETTWAGRVKMPIPVMELHEVAGGDELDDDEVTELLKAVVKARQDPNGALMWTPASVDLRVHGEAKADVLLEARNGVRLDVANFTGLPAPALDGSLSTASLTYTTTEGKRSDLADAVDMWAAGISARLSQDDVVRPGRRVRFDFGDHFQPAPTGATTRD